MDEKDDNQYQPFQQYQTTQPTPPIYPQMQAHRGTMILIFGIVGLVGCGIFGLLAWLFGNEDLKKMAAGQMDPSGRDTTSAGRIMGIITVVINGIGILFGIIYAVFVLGVMGAAAGGVF